MSAELYQFLLSLSIALPFMACMLRFKQIPKTYYPLVVVITLGFLNELLTFYFFRDDNAIPINVFNIVEYILYCWQFHNWRHILKGKYFYLAVAAMLSFWIIDELVLGKVVSFTSTFLFIYPLVLVLFAVNELNYLVANDHGNIYKNAIFIFCIAIIIFYSYRILSETFYHYAVNKALQDEIFGIQMYVNVLFNILLTLVVLCLPKKRTITPL